MKKYKVYCPASLSFIFRRIDRQNIDKTGSLGIGCTLGKGVEVEVEKSRRREVFFNGKRIIFPTVLTVIKAITSEPVKVSIKSDFPLGCGFGISGASSLACAYALNSLFRLKLPKSELAKTAHKAEIENRTGLGSVGTQVTGGFLLKKTAGVDFIYLRLPFVGKKLYCVSIGTLETPQVLSDKIILRKINEKADTALKRVEKMHYRSLPEIIDISYDFCRQSGLSKNITVSHLLEKLRRNGISVTMAILGQTIISEKNSEEFRGLKVYQVTVSG